MHAEIIVLRLIHILGGIIWVGALLFTTVFLFPVLATVGPAAGQVMKGLRDRKLLTIIPVVALLTMLTGLRLAWIASAGSFGSYASSPVGQTFLLGGALAILAFIIGIVVARPAAERSARLSAEVAAAPDDPTRKARTTELEAARRRMGTATAIVAVLLVLAAAAMAVARYLG